ncbi:MAG: hypothetical protein Q9224_007164, partial [Gallowayella concinna]
ASHIETARSAVSKYIDEIISNRAKVDDAIADAEAKEPKEKYDVNGIKVQELDRDKIQNLNRCYATSWWETGPLLILELRRWLEDHWFPLLMKEYELESHDFKGIEIVKKETLIKYGIQIFLKERWLPARLYDGNPEYQPMVQLRRAEFMLERDKVDIEDEIGRLPHVVIRWYLHG